MRWFRKRDQGEPSAQLDPEVPEVPPGDGPVGWGYKSGWLAVRSDNPVTVVEALQLRDVREAPWTGAAELLGDTVPPPRLAFATPPVDGWVLVLLNAFSDQISVDMAAVSERFGEAQRFGTHRVVEYHEIERWQDGRPVRVYRYIGERGEVLEDIGESTDLEGEFRFMRAGEDPDDWSDEECDKRWIDEDDVIRFAQHWSVDPLTLDAQSGLPSIGLLGRF